MAVFEVATKDYLIMALILKDSTAARHAFTFKELVDTLQRIRFTLGPRGRLVYDGKVLLFFKHDNKSRDVVSDGRQDELKQKLLSTFGWTKGTFGERPKV